jgi:hypothetical protein
MLVYYNLSCGCVLAKVYNLIHLITVVIIYHSPSTIFLINLINIIILLSLNHFTLFFFLTILLFYRITIPTTVYYWDDY